MAQPQTSCAVSITSRSLARCASTAMSLPCTVLLKPHWAAHSQPPPSEADASQAARLYGSAPNLLRRLNHQPQFGALRFHRNVIAMHCAAEAALG